MKGDPLREMELAFVAVANQCIGFATAMSLDNDQFNRVRDQIEFQAERFDGALRQLRAKWEQAQGRAHD